MFNYRYDELINPTLQGIKILGGSGSNDEISDKIIELLNLSEDEINDIHKGNTTKLDYRLAWARTYLKNAGYIINSLRGVWSLTEKGNKINSVDNEEVRKFVKGKFMPNQQNIQLHPNIEIIEMDNSEVEELTWQDSVLELLKSIEPYKFEKLCQRLLRELGFSNVVITGKTNDGGIDGKGILKIGVISFHTAFQAKRYSYPVGSSVIRDFRGAMMGRADKGLIITTNNFTRESKKEAQRDGATPIDLIDGNELAERLKEFRIGIDVEMVEKVHIKPEWFANI